MSLPEDILRFSTFDEAVKALKKHNLHSIVQTELYADEDIMLRFLIMHRQII